MSCSHALLAIYRGLRKTTSRAPVPGSSLTWGAVVSAIAGKGAWQLSTFGFFMRGNPAKVGFFFRRTDATRQPFCIMFVNFERNINKNQWLRLKWANTWWRDLDLSQSFQSSFAPRSQIFVINSHVWQSRIVDKVSWKSAKGRWKIPSPI